MAQKVIHASSAHMPLDIRIFWKEASSLADSGYDVTLLVPSASAFLPAKNNVRFETLPLHTNRFKRFFGTSWSIFKYLRRHKDAIAHVHDPDLLPFIMVLKMLGHKVVFDMHEHIPNHIYHKEWIPALLRPVVSFGWRIFEHLAYRLVPVVLAAKSCNDSYQWIPQKTNVYNYPMTSSLVSIARKRDANPSIAYLGGIMPDRCSDIVMKAVYELHKKGNCPHFHMIGPLNPYSLKKEYQKWLAERGCDHYVTFHGYQPYDDAIELIKGAHIGICTLRPKPNYVNTFMTKMLEYMALSMPVITSNFPLHSTIVKQHDCGLIVDPESVEDLVNGIEDLMADPKLAEEMGLRGREAVKGNYNWESQKANLLALYEKL
jgi:glycosyltransferase involved in cell wall biosynthesis